MNVQRWALALLVLTACPDKDRTGTDNGWTVLPDGAVVGGGDGNNAGDGAIGDGSGDGNGSGDGDYGDPNEPIHIDDCKSGAAGLTDQQITALKAGGAAGSTRLLYPYDGTVFPRGIGSPTLMWDGANASVAYVHIKSTTFEYEGCLPVTDNRVQLSQEAWEAAGAKTFGAKDPFSVEVSVLDGGSVRGPLKQSWTIAQATIKGSIYYNNYVSASGGALGQVYRIPPGGEFERFGSFECNGCHSVSANGERMVSQTVVTGGRTFDISSGVAQELVGLLSPTQPPALFAALYPDGSRFLAGSNATDVGRSFIASPSTINAPATLYDTDTGSVVPSTGIPPGALMPSFSTDGSLLTFVDNDVRGAHGLGIVNYDVTKDSASGYTLLLDDQQHRPGWPFVLPDNQAVLFVRTDAVNWGAEGLGVLGSVGIEFAPYSELFLVDISTKKTTILARAMGYANEADAAANKTYLPFPEQDTRKVYFPTISPVAAGGYFWIFFDAIRNYGNHGVMRQLWGAAIEISPDGDYSVDRSAPAFYLPGQEFGTGNHRAFTALDPCKEDGVDCTSGVDCCGGFCIFPEDVGDVTVGAVGKCSSEPRGCSREDERCSIAGDCCEPEGSEAPLSCIAGFCTKVEVF